MSIINIGLDLGYSATKIVHPNGRSTFPSLVGTPEKGKFRLTGASDDIQITYGGREYNVGEIALEQSRFAPRPEGRDWIDKTEYMVLFHAALSQVDPPPYITETHLDIRIVTGLPVLFFEKDELRLKALFQGDHEVLRTGRHLLTANAKCVVMPQPMGTLFNAALNEDGKISDAHFARGRIGVIDIGGKTTNLLHAKDLGDVDVETSGVNLGGWDAVRAMKVVIEDICPDVGYDDHEIAQSIIDENILWKGRQVNLSNEIEETLTPMAHEIAEDAKQLWPGGGGKLKTILISSGGAMIFGRWIKPMFGDHADVRIGGSVYDNAAGYRKAALFYEATQR